MKLGFSFSNWIRRSYNYEIFHKFIDEIALVGYDGIEISSPIIKMMYEEKPNELGRLLKMHGLEVSATYTGVDFSSPEGIRAGECKAKELIDFYSQVGCRNFLLDATGSKAPRDEYNRCVWKYTDVQLTAAAEATNRIARAANASGMVLSWHTHSGTFFENQELFTKFWDQTDPALVNLCPDMGQNQLVGVDPAAYTEKYIDRIKYYVHYKDIDVSRYKGVSLQNPGQTELYPGHKVPENWAGYTVDAFGRWIETGRGDVDFPAITRVLNNAGFDGWFTCDLDQTAYTPMDSARACKEYMNRALNIIGDRDKKKK